jgi:hypothetical protein
LIGFGRITLAPTVDLTQGCLTSFDGLRLPYRTQIGPSPLSRIFPVSQANPWQQFREPTANAKADALCQGASLIFIVRVGASFVLFRV